MSTCRTQADADRNCASVDFNEACSNGSMNWSTSTTGTVLCCK
jgi:hypothetical protein